MKKILYFFGTLFLTVSMVHCSGTSLVDQFAASQAETAGAINILALQHDRNGEEVEANPDGSKTFTNDLGYEVILDMGHLHFHSIKLISEGEDPRCFGGMDQTISLHHDRNLLGEDLLTHNLATAVIPMTFYCSFEITLGSDGDHALKFAHGDEGEESAEIAADAFHVMGTWSKDGDSGSFELTGTDPVMVSHKFKTKENDEVIEHPVHFHEGETVIEVLIGTKYDLAFDGVDFKIQMEDEQIDTIYGNLGTAVHQHTGDHHGSAGHDDGNDHDHP